MFIPDYLRHQVVHRAQSRCEYCGISQDGQEAAFHIDHVLPVIAGGATVEALKMNRPVAEAIRRHEVLRGLHPPPGHL